MTDTNCTCEQCGEPMDTRRREAGYNICRSCGESNATRARATWCVAPMHKSNYMLITNTDDLTGLNNKGGLVR